MLDDAIEELKYLKELLGLLEQKLNSLAAENELLREEKNFYEHSYLELLKSFKENQKTE